MSHASQFFLKAYFESVPNDINYILDGPECTIKFTSKWLLKKLLAHLHLHMEYKCVHKKFGTMLDNKSGDLLVSLSWALGRASIFSESACDFHIDHSGKDYSKQKVLREAGEIVNDLFRGEISKSNSENWHFQPNYFNVHKEVEKINPLLWHFIECATSSTQERKGTPSREENTFIKKCRRLFLVSIVAFCTNTQHTTLMHTLLADTIEMCGVLES